MTRHLPPSCPLPPPHPLPSHPILSTTHRSSQICFFGDKPLEEINDSVKCLAVRKSRFA